MVSPYSSVSIVTDKLDGTGWIATRNTQQSLRQILHTGLGKHWSFSSVSPGESSLWDKATKAL